MVTVMFLGVMRDSDATRHPGDLPVRREYVREFITAAEIEGDSPRPGEVQRY
jgi:hypothetical protein